MANKYDLELALDSYRAQNGKESEVGLMDSGDVIQYGSQRFSNREQAMWWLKQQKPNHDAIQKMIAEERKNYPNSGLNPLMETYEKYYKQVQVVQSQTEKKLGEEKIVSSKEESIQTIPGETRRVDDLPESVRYPSVSPSSQPIPGETRRVDNQPEVSRRPIEPIVSKPKPVPQTLKDTEETTQESSLTQSINRDLSLALSAVRDEIREAKKVSSIKWNNKEGKAKIVAEIDSLIAQAMTLSPKDMVVKTHEILSKARTQSIIEKDQIVPLVSLYMVNPPDAKKIRDAAVSIIRASNGSTQMHEIFYSRNANTIDARIAKFTSAEKDTLGKEINKLTSKMDHNLNKIAEKEWSVNSVEIKKQNPSMDLATFTKEYKENYRKYVQSDLERKLAIKLIGDVEFKKQDATLWNQYNSAVDPLDEWETFSDETATAAANFVVYDLTSMLISGGVAGLIGRGAVLATRGALGAGRVTEIVYGAGRINSVARGAGAVARAGIEGTAFTATHALVRNQEWFTSQPDWEKQIVLGSLGFGLFRSAQSGVINNLFAGIKSPVVNGLVKQGLIIPAIITGVQVGAFEYDRIKNKDPDIWNDAWSNFLLNAALGGLFAFAAKGPTRVSNNAITEQTGFIKLQDRTVPMTRNADGTITLQVPGKGGAMKDITFKPSKELESQLRVPTAPAQPTSPVSTPNNAPRGPIPANQQPSLQDIKNYFAVSDPSTAIIFTTKTGKYEYAFGQSPTGTVSLRKLKTETIWQKIEDKDIPKNIQTQMRQRAGDTSAGTIPVNPTTQPTSTPNQAPVQQTTLTTKTYKDIGNAVVDTLKKEDAVSIAGIVIKKGTKKGQYEWTGKNKDGADINKTGTKDQLLQSIKDDLPTDKVILDARNVRPGTVKESYFTLGQDKYLIDEAGNFRKSTASGAQNLSEAEVTALINAHPESVAIAIMDSHAFKSFLAKAGYLNKEGKYLKNIWSVASTEIAPTTFLSTIGGYPLNLVRLPFIQTQRLINVWGSGNHGAIPAKVWDSIKVLGIASSTPFANKTQGLATLLTMGTVAWAVKNQIDLYNADTRNTDKVGTPGKLLDGEYAAGATWRYLASLNITVPYDVAKWIYESTIGDGK